MNNILDLSRNNVAEIEIDITAIKKTLKKTKLLLKISIFGIVFMFLLSLGVSLSPYSPMIVLIFEVLKLFSSFIHSINYPLIYKFYPLINDIYRNISMLVLSSSAMVYLFAAIFFIVDINSLSEEINVLKTKRDVFKLLDETSEKLPYIDSLMRIDIENLEANYRLVKEQMNKSFNVTLGVCILGFILIGIGLIAGIINFSHLNIITYISSGAGIITEVISSIFFAIYSKNVQQMKNFHNDLLELQSILLSWKFIESMQNEKDKIRLTELLVNSLRNKKKQA